MKRILSIVLTALFIAVGVFWPFFAIKYLFIGIWYLISTGFSLLVGV